MTDARRIYLIFFLQPIALGAWLPQIPGVQSALGLSNSALALALIGAPVGILTTLLVAGRIATWLGARHVVLIFYPLFLLSMLLPFLAPTQWLLMAALVLVGSSMSVLELGLNIVADTYEKSTGHHIMSRAHGCWSFGLLTGTLIGSTVAGLGQSPFVAGLIIALVVEAMVWPVIRKLPEAHAAEPPQERRRGFRLPHPVLLGVCFFTFGTTMVEGAIEDWAAVFLRDVFEAEPGLAGLGVSLFAFSLATTRFFGDRLRQVASPGRLGQGLAVIGLLGLGIIWMAPSLAIAFAGLTILGIGTSLAFPLGVIAASRAPGTSAASNVAILSFVALLGFLVGPLTIGPIADAYGIRTGLMVLVPMVGLSLVLATCLTMAGNQTGARPGKVDVSRKSV
jgi:MFS family permease